jgi:hypothetical protein
VSGLRQDLDGTLTLKVEAADRDTWEDMVESSSWLVQAPAAWRWKIDWVSIGIVTRPESPRRSPFSRVAANGALCSRER